MITALGEVSVGGALPVAATATAAIDATVAVSLPEASAKLQGYGRLLVPSPDIDISAQAVIAAGALTTALAELSAILPTGPGLVASLNTAVAATQTIQASIKTLSAPTALKIDAALAQIAAINVSLSAGISGPNINMAAITARWNEVVATIASIEAQAEISAAIEANLDVGGLRMYRFDGDISTAGAELQAQITADGLTGSFHFVVMLPTNGAAWTALQATVKTS